MTMRSYNVIIIIDFQPGSGTEQAEEKKKVKKRKKEKSEVRVYLY